MGLSHMSGAKPLHPSGNLRWFYLLRWRGTHRHQHFSRDMNADVLANGLPLWQGVPVAVDATFARFVSGALSGNKL